MMFKAYRIGLLAGGFSLAAWAPAQAELVSYWNFNETSGGVLEDVVNSHDGTLYNGPQPYTATGETGAGPEFVEGRPGAGNALRFNDPTHSGTTVDAVMLDATPHQFGKNDFTVSGWFRTDTAGSAHSSIINNAVHNNSGFGAIIIREGLSTTGKLQFGIKGDGSNIGVISQNRLDDGQWHWFAGVVKDEVLTLYVDGVKEGTAAYGTNTNASPGESNTFIGVRRLHLDPFFGLIDDLSIFNSALSGEIDGDGNLIGGELDTLYERGPLDVPEPAASTLMGSGLALCLLRRRRDRTTKS